MKIVCFHNPEEENGFLSNCYHSVFKLGGTSFTSMEQFMMYGKAVCFKDDATAVQILNEVKPARIKELGRQVSGYDDNTWNGVRQLIVYEGLLAKFSQNILLKEKLLETGDSVLAECAVKDRIWGIGLAMTDPRRLDPSQWRGNNLLGYALMVTRSKLSVRL